MEKEQAVQILANLINTCVSKGGIFASSNDVIVVHNALITLLQDAQIINESTKQN